ncbi:hypothetical protein B0T14DRAFT_461687 [Immersiella caudata]|uniref:Nephrocystin 3-like N-terminal domain-containing protein n=1 Tax=Immersiella caudata TaxID=314043 RepID=A0AA39WE44_9PEZI|nr:hypothetical protein B0T14DRAFT_461687 [Immersiella caudata]
MASLVPKVYRARNLSSDADSKLSAAKIISAHLGDVAADDVVVYSVADEARTESATKTRTATVMFRKPPSLLQQDSRAQEWVVRNAGNIGPIIDTHFFGLTSLNHVNEPQHRVDCIAICGLAGHPFGSWQPHGGDKDYMWIRDTLPAHLPHVRFYIYGYDTAIAGSNSTQNVKDISGTLINTLQACNLGTSDAKPLVFLAHSLGGVVLKQALVQVAKISGKTLGQRLSILDKISGIIFFGVPSSPMPFESLHSIVQAQPNEGLVRDLTNKSEYLGELEDQFSHIPFLENMTTFWAYETKLTRTVAKARDGALSMSGPLALLVDRASATSQSIYSHRDATIQIDEDHSGIVKFRQSDTALTIIIHKLQIMVGQDVRPISGPHQGTSGYTSKLLGPAQEPSRREAFHWDLSAIRDALRASQRDLREDQIEKNYEGTFSWVYDDDTTGFRQWLLGGRGIYWIRGKPGSGKSTLMKYIYHNERTAQLLHEWGPPGSRAEQMQLGFFFHHRGSEVQRSFSGLLRSIITQIFEQKPQLLSCLGPALDATYHETAATRGLGSLQSELEKVFTEAGLQQLQEEELAVLLRCQQTKPRQSKGSTSLARELRRLLKSRGVVIEDVTGPDGPLWPDSSANEALLSEVQREELRLSFYTREEEGGYLWSQSQLLNIIDALFTQRILSMHICLFLDALDEYDGEPEFITGFLRHIQERGEGSRCRMRICFSSRPWAVFERHFGSSPGFAIHKYNEDDISRYCWNSIDERFPNGLIPLSSLVPSIIERARGVFVWVRLVLRDLFEAVTNSRNEGEGHLRESLKQCLDSLPDELDDYYESIIDRIEETFRWAAYVVLEILSRIEETVRVDTMLKALAISKATTGEEAERGFRKLHLADKMREAKSRLRSLSGSLIEFRAITARGPSVEPPVDNGDVDDSDDGDSNGSPEAEVVQLMHQTVKDFVLTPDFKRIVLRSRSAHVVENGHTFLARTYLFDHGLRHNYRSEVQFVRQAQSAERTTGKSQFRVFQHRESAYRMFERLIGFANVSTILPGPADPNDPEIALSIAASSGLLLYLEDSLVENPSVFANSRIDLLWLLVHALMRIHGSQLPCETALAVANLMIKNGYTPPSLSSFITRSKVGRVEYGETIMRLILMILQARDSMGCNIWEDTNGGGASVLSGEAAEYVQEWGRSYPELVREWEGAQEPKQAWRRRRLYAYKLKGMFRRS